jgi:hypothetical protein
MSWITYFMRQLKRGVLLTTSTLSFVSGFMGNRRSEFDCSGVLGMLGAGGSICRTDTTSCLPSRPLVIGLQLKRTCLVLGIQVACTT